MPRAWKGLVKRMSGVKGKSGPPGNKNAEKHGFYAYVLPDDEAKLYLAAQNATLADEVAVGRIKLNRLLLYMSDPANEVSDGTMTYMDRMIGRIGDLEVKRSIIERNARESGALDEDDDWMDRFQRTGAHRATFKGNGKAKSNGRNGST